MAVIPRSTEWNYRHTSSTKRLSKALGHSKTEWNFKHTFSTKMLSKASGHSNTERNCIKNNDEIND